MKHHIAKNNQAPEGTMIQNLFRKLERFRKGSAGNILIIGAGGILMLVALVGGAVDIARYINVNSKFKDAADTALLAAVSVSKTQDVDEVAKKFFEANFPPEYLDSFVLTDVDVTADPVNLEWTLEMDGEINMEFAQFVGFETIHVHHKVTVAWDVSARMEVLFTVDTSASMCMNVVRSEKEDGAFLMSYEPDYRCSKLNAMKEAMEYVIDFGLSSIDGVGGPSFYAGVIPFNHKVRFANPDNVPEPLLAGERARSEAIIDNSDTALQRGGEHEEYPVGDLNYFKNLDDAEPLSPIIPLKALTSPDQKEELKELIENIVQSPTGHGWTRSNIAVLTAALMLDKNYYSAFGGEEPAGFGPDVDKIVVMMTDGANMGCCYAAHPEGNFDNQYLYLYQADNAHLTGIEGASDELKQWAQAYNVPDEGLCKQLKDQGVTIYSVVYDVDDRDPGGEAIKNAYRGCASSDQYFFDVMSSEDLKLAYQTIAQSFLKLRIIY